MTLGKAHCFLLPPNALFLSYLCGDFCMFYREKEGLKAKQADFGAQRILTYSPTVPVPCGDSGSVLLQDCCRPLFTDCLGPCGPWEPVPVLLFTLSWVLHPQACSENITSVHTGHNSLSPTAGTGSSMQHLQIRQCLEIVWRWHIPLLQSGLGAVRVPE